MRICALRIDGNAHACGLRIRCNSAGNKQGVQCLPDCLAADMASGLMVEDLLMYTVTPSKIPFPGTGIIIIFSSNIKDVNLMCELQHLSAC